MDSFDLFRAECSEHRAVLEATEIALVGEVERTLELWERCAKAGGKIFLFGNGGSAADAQHVAAELVVRYRYDRPPIAAIALTTDTSVLTAAGNDLGYDSIFSRQIEALGQKGDVAVGFSTSGSSRNVLGGLRSARSRGLITIGFTGGHGGAMAAVCDVLLTVPSSVTARIQEMHILLGHILCAGLEARLQHPQG